MSVSVSVSASVSVSVSVSVCECECDLKPFRDLGILLGYWCFAGALVSCWGLGVLLGYFAGVLVLCWVLGAEGKRSVEKIRSEGPYPAEQTDILKTPLLKKLKISGANVRAPSH